VNGTENLRELLVKNGERTSDRPPFYLMNLLSNKGNISFINTSTWVICTIRSTRSMVITLDRSYTFSGIRLQMFTNRYYDIVMTVTNALKLRFTFIIY
jgi:hypothetical protein